MYLRGSHFSLVVGEFIDYVWPTRCVYMIIYVFIDVNLFSQDMYTIIALQFRHLPDEYPLPSVNLRR